MQKSRGNKTNEMRMSIATVTIRFLVVSAAFIRATSGYGLTGNPGTVEIYEDENGEKTVWAISGDCRRVESRCSLRLPIVGTCVEDEDVETSESCNTCTYTGDTHNFEMAGMTLKKKACSDTTCGFQTDCTAAGCLNYGTDYTFTVSCRYNTDQAETASVSVTVTENVSPAITSGATATAAGTMTIGTPVYTLTASNHDYTYMKTDVGNSYRYSTAQLFEYVPGDSQIKVKKALSSEYSQYLTMTLCARDRRDEDCQEITIKLTSCYDVPTCNDYNSVSAGDDFEDTHAVGDTLTTVTYPDPDSHFNDWSATWPGLSFALTDTGGLTVATVGNTVARLGQIYTTANITVHPFYEYKDYIVTNTISNTGSCETSTCTLTFRIYFKNWPIEILSLPASGSLHEDHDGESLIHEIITYDYNNEAHDNVTCVIDSVTPSDTALFEIRTNGAHDYDSFFLWKRTCQVAHQLCGFQCDVNTGCFNHDTVTSYDIEITCSDGYGSSDTKTFTLNVDVNEPQVFTNLPNTISLNADRTANTDIIFSITYTDAENEDLFFTYTFTPSTGYFSGSPSGNYHNSLGNISLTTYHWTVSVNESYTIHICSTERRNMVCSYLYVNIEDRCGPDPECSDDTNTVTDQHLITDPLFTLAPSNAGSLTSPSYSVTSSTSGLFTIGTTSGVVTALRPFSSVGADVTYYLNGYIYDTEACRFAVCSLTLVVTFTNQDPSLDNLPATGTSLHEDTTAETSVYQLSVTESDPGDSVTCSVQEGSSSPANNGKFFTRETYTGSGVWNVWCRDNPGLDFSGTSVYTVSVQCTDTHGGSVSGDLTINVLENQQQTFVGIDPVAGHSISVNPSNYGAGDSLFTVVTSDAEGDTLAFTFAVLNSMTPLTCTSDGVVQQTRTLAVLDTDQVYWIDVTVTDAVHNYVISFRLTVTFAATNTKPVLDTPPSGLTFAEDTPTGTTLHTVLVTDPDVGDTHSFNMTVAPSAYTDWFSLQSTSTTKSAALTLAAGKSLDYETQTTFTFTIYVTDQSDAADRPVDLTITITDVNEAPVLTLITTSLTIDEGASGTTVGHVTFTCIDVDAGSTLVTSLSGTYSSYFSLASDGDLTYAADWDLESSMPTSATLSVTCSDGTLTSSAGTLYIRVLPVNEYSPTPSVTSAIITLTPSTAITDVLLTVTATDSDYGDDGVFTYSILGIGIGWQTFTMTTAGQLMLIERIQLDYDKNYTFTIKISDGDTPNLFSGVSVFARYYTDYTPATPERPTYCLTCTTQGRAMVGLLAFEGVAFLVIIVHLVVHFIRAHFFSSSVGNNLETVQVEFLQNKEMNDIQDPHHDDDEQNQDENEDDDTASETSQRNVRYDVGRDRSAPVRVVDLASVPDPTVPGPVSMPANTSFRVTVLHAPQLNDALNSF